MQSYCGYNAKVEEKLNIAPLVLHNGYSNWLEGIKTSFFPMKNLEQNNRNELEAFTLNKYLRKQV